VKTVGTAPFEFCGRDSEGITLKIGDKVEVLPNELFGSWVPMPTSAPNITSVLISSNSRLKEISSSCFRCCSNINAIFLPETIERVRANAFDGCDINVVYYASTLTDWEKVDNSFSGSIVYFYSEFYPEEEGNYWHYDENGNRVIWEQESYYE
jgi:hypothetical protein